ncbi:amidase [Solibacillus sp. FSL W7-1436]|uniref:amidase n=1 Tax=Solibacillus sp. FSL W7-1436 TaxID=2921705 RepID=UPI0030F70873
MKAYLDRIKLYDPSYNAFTTMNTKALEQAKELDKRRAKGEKLGKLAGIPVVIKEGVDMAGFPQTMGWDKLSPESGGLAFIPEKDATIVARLKAADAIILGRTNMPAFASDGARATSSWDGDTYNVVNKKLVPGASSSGTAAAVSGNMAVLGVAEETGGSIQNPAGAQALVGVKTTFGLVPTSGVVPLRGSTHDVLGPNVRTVRDAAVMLDVIAGYSYEDPKTVASIGNMPVGGYTSKLSTMSLSGKRIGLYGPGWGGEELTKETQQLYEEAIKVLKARGAIVVTDPFADTKFAEYSTSPNLGVRTLAYDMEQYLNKQGPGVVAHSVDELFKKAGAYPDVFKNQYPDGLPNVKVAPDLSDFVNTKTTYMRMINGVIDKYDLDAFVYPQTWKEIPLLDSKDSFGNTTVPEINIAGIPQVNLPAGYYKSGTPFSLAFFGKAWSEAELLGMAYDYEQATHHRKAPVLVTK